MKIIQRLIARINNNTDETITVREVLSGHSKGMTGVYRNKTRIFVTKERKALISRLNELYSWSICKSQEIT